MNYLIPLCFLSSHSSLNPSLIACSASPLPAIPIPHHAHTSLRYLLPSPLLCWSLSSLPHSSSLFLMGVAASMLMSKHHMWQSPCRIITFAYANWHSSRLQIVEIFSIVSFNGRKKDFSTLSLPSIKGNRSKVQLENSFSHYFHPDFLLSLGNTPLGMQ